MSLKKKVTVPVGTPVMRRRLRQNGGMTGAFPISEPHEQGLLDVGDGNLVYWEVCGNPDGKPALVVHGGPGSRLRRGASAARFDPDRYRIVLFDQRGCGRSTPHASDPATDMRHNTTEHLLADMERLREHLGIDRWLLYGGSWGSTLILAYAERHPERVSEIVIPGVTMTRRSEIDWLYRGVGRFFPEAWERFRAGVPGAERDGDIAGRLRAADGPTPTPASATRPRTNWWRGRTRSSPWRSHGSPAPTATGRRPRCSPSSASARTTSPTAPGWRKACCCATRTGWPASPACSSTAASTWAGRSETAWELARPGRTRSLVVVEDSGHTGSAAMTAACRAALAEFAPD